MSLYSRDKHIEEIVSKWTEQHIFNTDSFPGRYIRNHDFALQKQGIDFKLQSNELFKDNDYHNIDEKAATSYIKTNLKEHNMPTFAFELDYKNRAENIRNEGWLFGNQFNHTEYYLISWIWADVPLKKNGFGVTDRVTIENILKAKLFLIRKQNLLNYLESVQVTKNNFMKISEKIRRLGKNKIIIPKGSTKKTPNIQYSAHLSEKPVNVVLSEYKLKELSIKTWEIQTHNFN